MDHARTLLKGIPAVQHPCDLDLLVFFAKHPRTLLSSQQLARILGYELNEIARSRDALIAAGLVTRTQDRTRSARMYVFAIEGTNIESLPAVVELASTRPGRLALRQALALSPLRRERNATHERQSTELLRRQG